MEQYQEELGLDQERALLILKEHAQKTWSSMEKLICKETSLPFDRMCSGTHDRPLASEAYTSPTNIAALLWSTIAARDLGIIDSDKANGIIGGTLNSLTQMERRKGFFLDWYDPRTGEVLPVLPVGKKLKEKPRRLLISTLDNAWLAVSLMILSEAKVARGLIDDIKALLGEMNFRFFYNEDNGLLHGGCYPDTGEYTHWFYGALNSEARIASYVGIGKGDLPGEHYFRMHRTFPPDGNEPQSQTPRGEYVIHQGVKVFEGHYSYSNIKFVPTYNGTVFEAFLVPQFVPEREWGPNSWGKNHQQYARAQIEYGQQNYGGCWGISPCTSPDGNYHEHRAPALGMNPNPYLLSGRVVTPYASFLALEIVPQEALGNLERLARQFKVLSKCGFYDAVDVSTGKVSPWHLTFNQGMIMAAIVNYVDGGQLRNYFGPQIESPVRPLLTDEAFSILS